MPTITYIQPDSAQKDVQVNAGMTVMQGAVINGVRGIEAECGGNLSCATCHVFILPTQLSLLPEPRDDELAMLEGTAIPKQDNSRLSCQLTVTDALDGLVVQIASRQS